MTFHPDMPTLYLEPAHLAVLLAILATAAIASYFTR